MTGKTVQRIMSNSHHRSWLHVGVGVQHLHKGTADQNEICQAEEAAGNNTQNQAGHNLHIK